MPTFSLRTGFHKRQIYFVEDLPVHTIYICTVQYFLTNPYWKNLENVDLRLFNKMLFNFLLVKE